MAYPSSILNLTNWKITLPTGSSGSPTEILQPKLATYSDSHFGVSGSHVLFTAPCNGVTTSGSSYPRSELREMKNSGKDKASWSNKSQTRTLDLDMAFAHLPSNKPHVVGGQIHGADDDITVLRLEGSKLYVTKGDDPHWQLITASYVLGTRFTFQFKARPGGIDFNYNAGAWTHTLSGNYYGCYFKAGCYTQSNESGGAYGQTAFWSVVLDGVPVAPVAKPAAPLPPPDNENPCGG